ncbi:MAG: polyprenyl synthetase family protein [Patescibacteria group bacterium]
MDFKRYLEENAKNIDQELDLILSDFLNETKKTNIKLVPFALGFLNACKGGKRIRGVLVKLGFEIASPFDKLRARNDVVRVGAALEILHTALLIHDDIMDKSPTRRGQPALHEALGGGHLGMSQAISLGDIGLYLPIRIITESNFPGEYKLEALKCLSQTLINTGWGQIMDMEKGDIEFVNLYKTAKYTIAGPLQIGAILAGVDNQLLGKLGEFGESLGIAYQIRDDMLDGEEVDITLQDAVEYILKAKSLIADITEDKKFSKLLTEMADFLIERKL